MKPPPLLRAVKPPVLPPPPARSSVAAAPRPEEDTGARPRSATLRVGRYEVDAKIATGGMATVHLGRVLGAAGFSRIVAIKRLLPQFAADPEFESMFVAEAQLAARIHHPNVVPTLDVVSSDGELLLVMEYVAGESLARLTLNARAESDDVPQPVALAIICDALHGLHAAHEAKDRHGKPLGIVHRDMSPQNVIVGTDGVARVIDFGIAKAANSVNVTREGMVRGKAAYMAPEQLSCEALSRRTDLYPLGVMLWELLVGDRLFPGGTRPDLIAKVEGRIPRPRSRVPTLSQRLEDIVMRALATQEADRFVTALDMAQAIEGAAAIAPRTQVAAWVERHAKAALTERAAVLASVESMARSVPPPATDTKASGSAALTPLVIGAPGVPSISVPNLAFTPPGVSLSPAPTSAPQRKMRTVTWLAGGAAAVLLLVGSGFALKSPSPAAATPAPEQPAAAAAAPVAAPAVPAATAEAKAAAPVASAKAAPAEPTPTEAAPTAATAPTTAPAAEPEAKAPVAPAAKVPTAAAAPHTPAKSRESKKATPAAAKPAAPKPAAKAKNCSPPYTTDAQGRRKYKAECF